MITVSFGGVNYNLPEPGDAFTQSVTDYLNALASKAVPYSYGSSYLKSLTTNAAATGWLRLAPADTCTWRNNANSADLPLGIDASDNLVWNGQILGLTTIAPPTWIAPSLLNSWVNYGAPYTSAGYYRDASGIVHLRGLLKSGTVTAAAFTLPAGYRPSATLSIAVISNGTIGTATIDASGNVVPAAGSNVSFALDGVAFRAEA